MTLDNLLEQLQVSPTLDGQNDVHKVAQWVNENVSEDVTFSGDLTYLRQYVEGFLSVVKKYNSHLTEPLVEFKGKNELQKAAQHGYNRWIHAHASLLQECLNNETEAAMPPLHVAALAGHVATVKTLCSLGADANTPSVHNQRPIHCALMVAVSDSAELVEKKLQVLQVLAPLTHHVLVCQDKWGRTILHLMASMTTCSKALSALLPQLLQQYSPFTYCHDLDGQYPIHVAIIHANWRIAECLLGLPGGLEVVDSQRRTPLAYAVQYDGDLSNWPTCYVDDEGHSAMHYAQIGQHDELVEWLNEHTTLRSNCLFA